MPEEKHVAQEKSALPVRELPDDNIYEKANFGDEPVNEEITKLQLELKAALKNRKNVDGQCVAYNNLGTAYYRLFKFNKAELCHYYHLQLGKESAGLVPFAEKRPENKKEKKIALVNLSCVYHAKREYELALQTFREALDYAEQLDDQASKARILNNLSNIYEDVCDFDSALECQTQRMEIVTALGDVNGQIKCAASLGSLYCLQGEIRSALENFEKAVINLRMKIVKKAMDAAQVINGGEEQEIAEENADFYDKGVI